MLVLFIFTFLKVASADLSLKDVDYLNELPLDKLISLESSLQELVTANYDNVTTTPAYHTFGAQALALNAPIKRTDYELKKGGQSKLGTLFSMSITTLAFLAFGGYLLCLIVQAVKAKESQNTTTATPAFFISAGIKKKPQPQFSSSYGRKRRNAELANFVDIPPEQLFDAMVRFCEGYAKWSQADKGGH
ncbi:uncharacterized protein LOC114366322 [Ostrinia furnacalis]|uniref:uncharacterized protein LOC114366322 n=1 Tax=Ostrinia furnacalis TaxID=93504 RepID=UPI0010391C65|nr:uncharacterized protein LOC114366322 [Ostrinia furnacalis]